MYNYITSGYVDLQNIHVLCIVYVYISVQYTSIYLFLMQ